jgi:intein/homing endonuclease
MTQIFKPNIDGYRVLTPAGFQKFQGVSFVAVKTTIRLNFEDGKFIECTSDHKIYVSTTKSKQACRIRVGEDVLSKDGPLKLLSKTKLKDKVPVYDLIGVENGARFYANSLLVSNCEPIIFEETLINALHLASMTGKEPVERQGQIRWYKQPKKGNTYLIGLDPSLGTGGDFAAIQIFELPSMEQVGEWQNNKTPIQAQVRLIKDIADHLFEITGDQKSIYYSVENNAIGEATLVAINEYGEENIKGYFLSESAGKGSARTYRKGFTTTKTSKLTACAKIKQLIESKRMTVNSKNLISELKTYISNGASYSARSGDTDDLVAALLLITRMLQNMQSYDVNLDIQMRGTDEPIVMPLPFLMG